MKKAFTLVELVVGMTISMLLMVSIGVFVGSGMNNIGLQKKVLEDNKEFSSDLLYLQKNILNSNRYVQEFSSGILLKENKYFDIGGYSYIGVKEFNGIYCSTGDTLNSLKTNHLYISNFIPYEEIGEDINNNFSEILTTETSHYKSNVLKHQIVKKVDNSIVVGKDIFGNKFPGNGVSGTGVFLNSPTALVEAEGKLIFSDTLNDRVLYLSGSEVYKLLDERDGLFEPTGLAYDDTNNILYIANSGRGEILKLSSETKTNNPNLVVDFIPENNFSANKIKIDLFNTTENLTNPDDKNDFSFTNISKSSRDYVNTENQKIAYYFINNYGTEQREDDCYGKIGDFIIDSNDNVIKCTDSGNTGFPTFQNTGTGKLANFTSKDFYSGTNYKIEISDILPNLVSQKNYYIKLSLLNDNNLKYFSYFPYFTQGDNDIFTKENNILEVIKTGLSYPSGIKISGNNLIINEFETREQEKLNLSNYSLSHHGNLITFSDSKFNNYLTSFIFSNPIKTLEKSFSNNLLNLKLVYYKYLNCFNEDEKIKKSFLIKKSY